MNRETKKTVRRLDLIRGALVLTLILYIAVALIINSSYLTVDLLMRLRSNVIYALGSSGDTVEIDPEDTLDLQLFQDGYAVLTRNGITVCGMDGNIYSEHILQYTNPRMEVCGKYILCYDRSGSAWCLLNSFRILCSGTEKGDIVNGAVTEDGYCAIVSERSEYKGCVTVYNTEGTDLSRWNSVTYLIDAFFTGSGRLTAVSVSSDREKTHTVFTVFDYKKAEEVTSVTAADTFPLALGLKKDGVEMLTASGALLFNGASVAATHAYPQSSPGIYRQEEDVTFLSYRTLTGTILAEAFSADGTTLFSSEYSSVLSLASSGGYFFLLTETELVILDSSGTVVDRQPSGGASRVLVSPEIALLCSDGDVTRLDLSALS